MAGREGGGSVVGQSHSNSERQQTATYGGTDTNGSGQILDGPLKRKKHYCIIGLHIEGDNTAL